MKLLGETNCLVFSDFSKMERDSFFEKFGHGALIDCKIFIDVRTLNEYQMKKYENFLSQSLSRVDFLILEFA